MQSLRSDKKPLLLLGLTYHPGGICVIRSFSMGLQDILSL